MLEIMQEEKSQSQIPPIDVLWIKGRENPENNYYFSFGGCHRYDVSHDPLCSPDAMLNDGRYEAHKRLGMKTIRVKLIKATVNDLRVYLGASTPDLK